MTKKSLRVSTSFSVEQTVLLDEILTIMLRGGDPKLLCRNKAFGSLCNTAKSLRRRAENPVEREKSTPTPAADTQEDAHATNPLGTLHPAHESELQRSQETAAAEVHPS